jgi:uncharacterized protein YndB with AHSA1/START domain
VVLTHLYEALPEEVFPLWLETEHLEKWWGPDGFTIRVKEFDPRPGGSWIFTMVGPDGAEFPNTIVYDEIVPNERLVYTHGTPMDPDPPFSGVVTFDAVADRTALSMRLVFESAEARDLVVEKYHAVEGGIQTLGRLADLVESGAE